MEYEPLFRCPACGSVLVEPCNGIGGMWQCRYHLCMAVFPVKGGTPDPAGREECPGIAEPGIRYFGGLAAPLTIEKVREVHHEVISRYGGTDGLLDEATLAYTVYRVNRIPDVVRQAAMILYCIAAKYPFIDGNKRTAFIVAENILGKEGFFISDEDDHELVAFMLDVAAYRYHTDEIEAWIRKRMIRSALPERFE